MQIETKEHTPDYVLQFLNPEGKPFCTINLDGSVEFSEGYEEHAASNEAAQILWDAVSTLFTANVKAMVKEELENMYKGKPPKEILE